MHRKSIIYQRLPKFDKNLVQYVTLYLNTPLPEIYWPHTEISMSL